MYRDLGDGPVDNISDSAWQNAVNYHDVKNRLSKVQKQKMRASAIRGIIQKAHATLGAVTKPYQLTTAAWEEHRDGELDIDDTIEADPLLNQLRVEKREDKRLDVIVCLDTSLSMTGRKLAITAVSLAVLALQLPEEDFSIVVFESGADTVKALREKMNLQKILEKFMEVPARGLTNIEEGFKRVIAEAGKGKRRRKAAILLTDGRYTAGGNPDYLVKSMPRLHVVQTGNPWASPRFCRNLAHQGDGKYLRVSEMEQLPMAMYSLIHEILR